ncbi:sugar phosphate isomerase/epimerase family protein [Brucella gallinifaecis]|uniref:Sugar phosphate isomerase/epimerase n=1 Tax=Brucella gallinifaecis TaxID=215590 RepID=A0A502BKB2_9HYPH|nr:sugar phosphate isomerase/epimerase [Brucella gallinifaecis]TPF74267.1 sugar phosphate isomerase/epimerase [Brucella gallinifaecis]
MKIGCQTFTWEMLGDGWAGSTDDVVRAIGAAGYAGIEITNNMIGGYDRNAEDFKNLLSETGLAFVAYAFSTQSGFTVEEKADEELTAISSAMDFIASFPGAILSLGCPTDHQGIGDAKAIETAGRIFNRAGELGKARGIPVAFHPSSHQGSVVVTRPQYEAIMAATDPTLVKWVPDTGHIIRGAQDIPETLSLFHERIAYVHLKDASSDGVWRMMGAGDCDIPGVIAHLHNELGFDGWLIGEEESDDAGRDPATAVKLNQDYLARIVA